MNCMLVWFHPYRKILCSLHVVLFLFCKHYTSYLLADLLADYLKKKRVFAMKCHKGAVFCCRLIN